MFTKQKRHKYCLIYKHIIVFDYTKTLLHDIHLYIRPGSS